MYRCEKCGEVFEKPIKVKEDGMFENEFFNACPFCGGERLNEDDFVTIAKIEEDLPDFVQYLKRLNKKGLTEEELTDCFNFWASSEF